MQGIVDQILNEETSLIGLTTIRDYDEYTFTHSVNVCIFSGRARQATRLTKLQLYDLGMAALFHDIGKSRVPPTCSTRPTALDDDEWRRSSAHPWLGVLALFQLRGTQELPYRAMVVAHEHHMKIDLTGYPRPFVRALSMSSKIVAVADGFDAATSRRSYQTTPYPPGGDAGDARQPARGMDPVIVKAFINLPGIYPLARWSCSTRSSCGRARGQSDPEMLSRPRVGIVATHAAICCIRQSLDLAGRTRRQFSRTIIKTEIRIGMASGSATTSSDRIDERFATCARAAGRRSFRT